VVVARNIKNVAVKASRNCKTKITFRFKSLNKA